MTWHQMKNPRVMNRNMSRRLVPVTFVLVCLGAVAAVKIALLLASPPALPEIDFPVLAPSSQPALLYPAAENRAATGDLADATIDARLMGVVGVGGRVVASLSVDGGHERIVGVGDQLADGVTVEDILPRAVVVREQDGLRQIAFKPLGSGQADTLVASAGPGQPAVDRTRLPEVQASLVVLDTGVSGLQIERLGDSLSAPGLMAEGDVVTAVGDTPLVDVMTDPGLLADQVDDETVTLTLLRDGTVRNLDVDPALVRQLLAQ